MRNIFLVFVLLLQVSCSTVGKVSYEEDGKYCWWPNEWFCCEYIDADFDPVAYFSEVDTDSLIENINRYAVEVESERKHKLVFEESIIYYDEQYIKKVWVKFITQDLVELWEARRMLTTLVEGYLESLNMDGSITQYAHDGVLTPINIDVTIVFESYFGKLVDPLYVGSINLQDGLVYYYAFDAFDIMTDYWHQRVEPYYKSLLLVNARTPA